jgi:hypothetical protein
VATDPREMSVEQVTEAVEALCARVHEFYYECNDDEPLAALVDACDGLDNASQVAFQAAHDRVEARAQGCTCGVAWRGHPNPHVSTCALFRRTGGYFCAPCDRWLFAGDECPHAKLLAS